MSFIFDKLKYLCTTRQIFHSKSNKSLDKVLDDIGKASNQIVIRVKVAEEEDDNNLIRLTTTDDIDPHWNNQSDGNYIESQGVAQLAQWFTDNEVWSDSPDVKLIIAKNNSMFGFTIVKPSMFVYPYTNSQGNGITFKFVITDAGYGSVQSLDISTIYNPETETFDVYSEGNYFKDMLE